MPTTQLPAPSERTTSDVLVYDGHCRFCTGQVRWLAFFDVRRRLGFLSLHDPEVARRYPDLTHAQLMEQMYVIDRRGTRRGGASAFRYLTRILPPLWPLALLLHVPFSLPVWHWCYRQIARRRYRWGKTDACENGVCDVHFK